jgi:hypothetical protein
VDAAAGEIVSIGFIGHDTHLLMLGIEQFRVALSRHSHPNAMKCLTPGATGPTRFRDQPGEFSSREFDHGLAGGDLFARLDAHHHPPVSAVLFLPTCEICYMV